MRPKKFSDECNFKWGLQLLSLWVWGCLQEVDGSSLGIEVAHSYKETLTERLHKRAQGCHLFGFGYLLTNQRVWHSTPYRLKIPFSLLPLGLVGSQMWNFMKYKYKETLKERLHKRTQGYHLFELLTNLQVWHPYRLTGWNFHFLYFRCNRNSDEEF